MNYSIASFSSLNQFPNGRLLSTYKKIGALAQELNLQALTDHVNLAVEQVTNVINLERKYWLAKKTSNEERNTKVKTLDPMIDRQLGSLYRIAKEYIENMPESAEGQAARKIIDNIFPAGVAKITFMQHRDQTAHINEIVKVLKNELAQDAATIALTSSIDRLETLNKEFEGYIDFDNKAEVTYDQVRAEKAKSQDNLTLAVALIVTSLSGENDDIVKNRNRLLEPIVSHNEHISSYYRMRRAVADVNPETDETIEPDPIQPLTLVE